jgi:hypothetical protein
MPRRGPEVGNTHEEIFQEFFNFNVNTIYSCPLFKVILIKKPGWPVNQELMSFCANSWRASRWGRSFLDAVHATLYNRRRALSSSW